ncbi:MAG: PD-(D/E)XK nuclease family protein [Phaeodactylibacter sp.]|uniref:PD-(D/E)XK nuclease family protein n=1 Tax=Phaeodactylibacter sp. TaxID=1940289 RepID=UPI0032EF3DF3
MIVTFGMTLDNAPLPAVSNHKSGHAAFGPQGLLRYLETIWGLPDVPRDNEYLRIEQYRQQLSHYLRLEPTAFFSTSFKADPFAVATDILERRDELLMAGWDLNVEPDAPPRLKCIAELEVQVQRLTKGLAMGFADRMLRAIEATEGWAPPFEKLVCQEPETLLPAGMRRLLLALRQQGVEVVWAKPPEVDGDTDLARLQQSLLSNETGQPGKVVLKGDGSLILLKGKRDTGLAAYFAQVLRQNEDYRPALVVPGQCQVLEHALSEEGLPELGLLSASLARPTLQVLKLATVFLWEPIDPYKVMEFVSLAVKPLERGLANKIAVLMAQRPGLFGEQWSTTIAAYFNELRENPDRPGQDNYERADQQYKFWFNRKRFPAADTVPKDQAIRVFEYVGQWAQDCFEDEGNKNASLLVLAGQARRISALLYTLPEERLTALELERVVRTVYEPAPVQLNRRAQGFLRYTTQTGSVTGPVDDLAWWNFAQAEKAYFFSRWYEPERDYLRQNGVALTGPEQENGLQLWHRLRPILHARKRLMLVAPDYINGQEVNPHPLMGDLEARCEGLSLITCDLTAGGLERWFTLPETISAPVNGIGRPALFIQVIKNAGQLAKPQERASYSSLSDLFYYPHKWLFRYKADLRPSALLSIVDERALQGNLAHRFFEELLKQEEVHRWTQEQVVRYLESIETVLLEREGNVLLMYGREPERVRFMELIKRSAWNLVRHIQEGGWAIEATEQLLEGRFGEADLKGYADLVLKRGDERCILDLKWSGLRYRESLLRNEEDLQLVLYARMLREKAVWPHTAFYIINKGVILARNNHAFKAAEAMMPDADIGEVNERIWERMAKTYEWRLAQIQNGQVEIRCNETAAALEEQYSDAPWLEMLEMKAEDAAFDDYRVLINLCD